MSTTDLAAWGTAELHVRSDFPQDYACANALDGRFMFVGSLSVSPVQAPSTGGVRPQAGSTILMAPRTVDEAKGDVRLRGLGPPI